MKLLNFTKLIKLLASYWNYFIINNKYNPVFCIRGVNPYNQYELSQAFQRDYLIASSWKGIADFRVQQYFDTHSPLTDGKVTDEYLKLMLVGAPFDLELMYLK